MRQVNEREPKTPSAGQRAGQQARPAAAQACLPTVVLRVQCRLSGTPSRLHTFSICEGRGRQAAAGVSSWRRAASRALPLPLDAAAGPAQAPNTTTPTRAHITTTSTHAAVHAAPRPPYLELRLVARLLLQGGVGACAVVVRTAGLLGAVRGAAGQVHNAADVVIPVPAAVQGRGTARLSMGQQRRTAPRTTARDRSAQRRAGSGGQARRARLLAAPGRPLTLVWSPGG